MHLLVLSAFRPIGSTSTEGISECLNAPFGAQCFPTDWIDIDGGYLGMSQCTFWCSVLSDGALGLPRTTGRRVSMHLLVLSAFRPTKYAGWLIGEIRSQCTFWCSVLSDQTELGRKIWGYLSQCTFWCSVLSDSGVQPRARGPHGVSMHLLVLSAFRPSEDKSFRFDFESSQCTFWCSVLSDS